MVGNAFAASSLSIARICAVAFLEVHFHGAFHDRGMDKILSNFSIKLKKKGGRKWPPDPDPISC
jgi:hypothetical protein